MIIDRRYPNPMKDPKDVGIYNEKIQERRMFELFPTIDDKFETVKREILKKEPLPSVDTAYSTVRPKEPGWLY